MSTVNIFDMADTWNNAGVDFTAIKMNVTDTASGAGSKLLDLLVGGSSRFSVEAGGGIRVNADGSNNDGLTLQSSGGAHMFYVLGNNAYLQSYNRIFIRNASVAVFDTNGASATIATSVPHCPRGLYITPISNGHKAFVLRSGSAQTASMTEWQTSTGEVKLQVDENNTLAAYNMRVDSSNYERGFTRWASNVFELGTEAAGTGTARPLSFFTNGIKRLTILENSLGVKWGSDVNGPVIFPFATSGAFTVGDPNGRSLSFYTYGSVSGRSFVFSGDGLGLTSGEHVHLDLARTFAPTSGTGSFTALGVRPTINQTGGASGEVVGLDISPTLTSAANWKAISAVGPVVLSDTNMAASGNLSNSLLDLSQTWNTTGTVTAVNLAVTDTASGTNSSLVRVASNGTTLFDLRKNGDLRLYQNTFLSWQGGTSPTITGWSGRLLFTAGNNNMRLASNGLIVKQAMSLTGDATAGDSGDVVLTRDDANVLAMRRDINPQNFRVYNTYTDGSNYERGVYGWAGNILELASEALGTGTARPLRLRVGGTVAVLSSTSGWQVQGDISANTGQFRNPGFTRIHLSNTDGVVTLFNNAQTDFNRLQFGGTTSAFPALKRVGANLAVRLADDSDYSDLEIHENLYFGDQNSSPRLRAIGTALDVITRDGTAFGTMRVGILQFFSDVTLLREGADTLALRRNTNPQTFRLYNTHTDSANYERGFIRWDTNNFEIGTERAGTGIARTMVFRTNEVNRFMIGSTGTVTFTIPAGQTFKLVGLPTADPVIAGALWNDGGTLKVSAG